MVLRRVAFVGWDFAEASLGRVYSVYYEYFSARTPPTLLKRPETQIKTQIKKMEVFLEHRRSRGRRIASASQGTQSTPDRHKYIAKCMYACMMPP